MQKQADSFNSQYDQAARIVTQKWDLERKTDSTRKQVSKQVSKQTSKQASKQRNKQVGKLEVKQGSHERLMHKANVSEDMLTQCIQECRTLALRFPSFLPIRFVNFSFKTAAGSPKRPPKTTPKRAQNEASEGGCLGGFPGGL